MFVIHFLANINIIPGKEIEGAYIHPDVDISIP